MRAVRRALKFIVASVASATLIMAIFAPVAMAIPTGLPATLTPGAETGPTSWDWNLFTGTGEYLATGDTLTLSGIGGVTAVSAPSYGTWLTSFTSSTVTWTYESGVGTPGITIYGFDVTTSPEATGTIDWSAMETSELGSTFTGTAIGPVPVPAPVFLLGTGLLALAWFRRKKPSGI